MNKIYNSKIKLLLASIIIYLLYIASLQFLPIFIITIVRVIYLVVVLRYVYLFFSKISSKMKMASYIVICSVLLGLACFAVINIYFVKDLILNESFDIKNNLYYKLDNAKEGEVENLEVYNNEGTVKHTVPIQYSDFDYKIHTSIARKLGYEHDEFELHDKIEKEEYIYYIMRASTANIGVNYDYMMAKVDYEGDVLNISPIDSIEQNVFRFILIEGDTDDLYYYYTSCITLSGINEDECYDYKVGTINEDGDISESFKIENHRIQKSFIKNGELYLLGSEGYDEFDGETFEYNMHDYLYKYDLNGKLILKEELDSINKFGFRGWYDMYLSDDKVYILYALTCSDGCFENEARLEVYDLSFNNLEYVVFNYKTKDNMTYLVENGDYLINTLHGNNFEIYEYDLGYKVETYNLNFQLKVLSNDIYINSESHNIVSDIDETSFEYININKNIIILFVSAIFYPLVIFDGIVRFYEYLLDFK